MHWWLSALIATGAQVDYLEGNHEFRLRRYVINNTLENYQLRPANRPDDPPALSVENLLGLKGLGIQYHSPYPEGRIWLNDNASVSHGELIRPKSGATVQAILQNSRSTEFVGHVHRAESAFKTVHPRKGAVTYGAVSLGTIARVDGYVPANKMRQNWQQGFGDVHYEAGNGLFDPALKLINDGRTLFEGNIYIYRNRTREIGEACGYDFNKGMKDGWKFEEGAA